VHTVALATAVMVPHDQPSTPWLTSPALMRKWRPMSLDGTEVSSTSAEKVMVCGPVPVPDDCAVMAVMFSGKYGPS
jgi:hypothetical protein